MDSRLFNLALRQIDELTEDVRLVVIHPQYKWHHMLLHHLLKQPDTHYVCFSGKKLSFEQAWEQIDQYLKKEKTYSTLILDESDRIPSRTLQKALKTLLTEGVTRVFLLSRELPPFVISSQTFGESVAIIPHDPSVMLWDYGRKDSDQSLLEVYSFGNGQVIYNGKLIKHWDGTLPRELFFYLIDRGMATRDDIFAAFWPTLSVTDATNVFHVTKRKINGVLGFDFTLYSSGYYQVSPDLSIHYDVMRFSEYLQMADVCDDLDETELLLDRARYLYRGAFLVCTDNQWARKRREELRENYADVLSNLAKVKRQQGLLQESLGLLTHAFSISNRSNEIAKAIMELYDSMNMPADGLAIYDRFHYELHKNFNQEPAFDVQQLAATMREKL